MSAFLEQTLPSLVLLTFVGTSVSVLTLVRRRIRELTLPLSVMTAAFGLSGVALIGRLAIDSGLSMSAVGVAFALTGYCVGNRAIISGEQSIS